MSQQDVEVIRDQYAAVNERDWERAMSHYAEEVELVVGGEFLMTGTFEGREAVGGWFADWFASFDSSLRFEMREVSELSDGVVLVVANHQARGRKSGVQLEGTVVWLYNLHAGKIVHVQGFENRDKAVEAAAQSA
jgi:ketosteroid isomerase-like protein